MGDRERERERSAEPRAPEFKTFVGGISWQTTDQELSDIFTKYAKGPVDARVMLDKMTGRSRGFGFVTFDTKEDMEECISNLDKTELEGRRISVTRAIPQTEIAPGAPAHSLHGPGRRDRYADPYDRGYRGGGDRHRGYDRGYDRGPPRGYERGGGGGYGGGYERAAYPERGYSGGGGGGYDRGYDRGYPEYERAAYPPVSSSYGRAGGFERGAAADPYYPPKDPYARDAYGYDEPPPSYGGYERPSSYGRGAYDAPPITDRYNGGSDRFGGSSAAASMPGGPERGYGGERYGSASRPVRPYDRGAAPAGRPLR
ncbi:g11999 [Coccomyxa viridis]|uniref:G11999 protein n=1 Tax=Coccomyxa viridis TaxID=1274662 RepID=A0ABP1G986_9CHLO